MLQRGKDVGRRVGILRPSGSGLESLGKLLEAIRAADKVIRKQVPLGSAFEEKSHLLRFKVSV
jgi:hypothetical protein